MSVVPIPWITRSTLMLALVAISASTISRVATAEPLNTAVRRTIIATGDMEASVRFYRDLLGFVVTFDVVLDNPAGLALLAPGATSARAVTLKHPSTPAGVGTIGFYQYDFVEAPSSCDSQPTVGAIAMLLLTDDMQGLYDKLTAAGAKPVAPPMSYQQREGRGHVDAFSVFDPNCMRVVFANLVDEVYEESIQK